MRVLLIEDDDELGPAVATGLRGAGFAVDLAADLAVGDFKVAVSGYDCLVVDRNLPDGDGARFVGRQRAGGSRTPVLILTARDGLRDRVEGFALGADDYLVKPFDLAELVARVRALCRRGDVLRPTRLAVGDILVDLAARKVTRAGIVLTLSPKEFGVLELLAVRVGQVVSRTEIIECCWDEMGEPESNVVDAVMARLRRRLGLPAVISTVRGVGFRLDAVEG
ncbi:DNA-binding response regulator [Pilimelia terevasa]|uniref:DNA-binding response regulator n=1 Tax=Pilimelia terevasa TaxID=53372 RepID=A0A8J3FGI1_9ACTN|nr:response regulator transcription factor [Pilimelia terevasa]GGK24858.1 DNA-binding response regulator [Pilimelia terevasa]